MCIWGGNETGELGIGSTSPVFVPTAVSGGLNFIAISPNANNDSNGNQGTNCGITTGNALYCWGDDTDGDLGDGQTTEEDLPVQSWLMEVDASTTVSVTVDPAFTFTVANQGSACNGESNFVSGAGTATTVALGHLAAGANVSGGQALSVVGNAGGGFAVYVAGTQASQNLRSGSHNWTDVTGTYALPAVLGAGERFGYTYKDSTSSSSVTNPASAKFIVLTNATTNTVMGSTTSMSGSGCVSYDAQASALTPAASYAATIVYTAVPAF